MTPFPNAGNGTRALLSMIRPGGFETSWAGSCSLRPDVFCLGSEDGRILFTDFDGRSLGNAVKASTSEEAINGIAFIKPWMSVSTRSEVMLWTLAGEQNPEVMGVKFPFGAHGVIAGTGKYFFAPLGHSGMAFYRPTDGPHQAVTISSGTKERVNIYRLASLQSDSGQEIVVCALRQGGVGVIRFKGEDRTHTLGAITFSGLDVVDVCPLVPGGMSTAAAALGADCTVILFRDALTDRKPLTLRYQAIKGNAYRVLSARGHLFILTSAGLYVLAGLVHRFSQEVIGDHVTPVLEVAMEAVDANLGPSQWVLIVIPDGVLRFDVELLETNTPQYLAHGEIQEFHTTSLTPDWSWREVEQGAMALSGI